MLFINATPGKDPKIEQLSLDLNSLLFELINDPHVLELCKERYLVKRFIVENMQIIHTLDWTGRWSGDMMWDPLKLPQYHPENFPFVIVRSYFHNFLLVNTKEYSV